MSKKPTKIFRVLIGRLDSDKQVYSDMCVKCIDYKSDSFPPSTYISVLFQIPSSKCKVCNAPNVLQDKD